MAIAGIRATHAEAQEKWAAEMQVQKEHTLATARKARQVSSLHLAGAALVKRRLQAELDDALADASGQRARAETAERQAADLSGDLQRTKQTLADEQHRHEVAVSALRSELEEARLATR